MTDPSDPRDDAAIDAACALHGVPMQPEWRTAVLASFATIAAAARFVEAFPLEDEAEYLPCFRA